MEKLIKRENMLLEYSPQDVSTSSPKTPYRSSEDTDFNDVFGGPPRRFSMQEVSVRYSFGETVESEEERSPWIVQNEKPVFGEEVVARRRRRGGDFYGDIFGGDESYSSPRKTDHDNVFGSNPSSRIMSPARPFTPKAEPYGTSLPAQFSLPSTLTKTMEHPVFESPSASVSKLLSKTIWRHDQTRKEFHQSLLSREASIRSEEEDEEEDSLISNERGNGEKLKKETKIVDSNENQFHFSIYKWAGAGVPMLLPLMGGTKNSKLKDTSGNYSRTIEVDRMESKSKTTGNQDFSAEVEKRYLEIKEVVKKEQNSRGGAARKTPESKPRSKAKDNEGFGEIRKITKSKQMKSTELDETDAKEKIVGEMPQKTKDVLKSEEVEKTGERSSNNVKKNVGTGVEVDLKSSLQKTTSKTGVKGKVKEFVNIFSQEADSKPKTDAPARSHSFRWRSVQRESEVISSNEANVKESLNLHPPKVEEDIKKYDIPTNQNNAVPSEFLNIDSEISFDYPDDPFEDNFVVEEISDDHERDTQSGAEGSDEMKALDAKIQEWSSGKKGNIRSLLSTLQYVLWAESGWTPVALVDLIEGNSVKRAYQKALLLLHPDKLQQKGAASSHKYIAHKVFDILQEAWDHFNSVAPL